MRPSSVIGSRGGKSPLSAQQQKLSGALAALLDEATRLIALNATDAAEAEGAAGAGGAGAGAASAAASEGAPRRPPPLPLGCLEVGWWQQNRQLLTHGATGAPGGHPCDTVAARVRGAADAAAARALIRRTQHGATGSACGDVPMLKPTLNPSGWFSVLHGLLKPLMRAVGRGDSMVT